MALSRPGRRLLFLGFSDWTWSVPGEFSSCTSCLFCGRRLEVQVTQHLKLELFRLDFSCCPKDVEMQNFVRKYVVETWRNIALQVAKIFLFISCKINFLIVGACELRFKQANNKT